MKKIIILLFFLILPIMAKADDKTVEAVIFTQTGCQHCAKAISLLNNLRISYPGLTINEIDLRKNPENYQSFVQFSAAYGLSADATPLIFIGDKAISGYREQQITEAVEHCFLPVVNCQNPTNKVAQYLKENSVDTKQIIQPTTNSKIGKYILTGVIISIGALILINKYV